MKEAIDLAAVDERRVRFTGVNNFRDLGGYRTESGVTTRWSRIFRSDSPHNFTPKDLEVFDALGVQVIYDLRREAELNADPGPRPYVHMELPSRPVFDTDPQTLRNRGDGENWLFEDYCGMLEPAAPVFGHLFSEIAECDGPVMFHCMGGKDRTGMTAALLLSWLGVDRRTVLDDYELTSFYSSPDHIPHCRRSLRLERTRPGRSHRDTQHPSMDHAGSLGSIGLGLRRDRVLPPWTRRNGSRHP